MRVSFASSVMRSMLSSGMSGSAWPVDSARLRSGSVRSSEVRCILFMLMRRCEGGVVIGVYGYMAGLSMSLQIYLRGVGRWRDDATVTNIEGSKECANRGSRSMENESKRHECNAKGEDAEVDRPNKCTEN